MLCFLFRENKMALEIVYVLTNPAMPGMVKIGYTSQMDANSRIAQLYTTGVPVPFTLEYACKVKNADEVEKALHLAFGPNRVNPKREFFRIDPEQAIAILKLLHTEDTTQEITNQPTSIDQQSLLAADQLKAKRPNLNFEEMQIPLGSSLLSIHDDTVVTVVSPRKVRLNDEEMSLTAATRKVLGIEHSVAPGPHWTFNGKILREIYNDTYGEPE
jgi:hypothetical protein